MIAAIMADVKPLGRSAIRLAAPLHGSSRDQRHSHMDAFV
jgi:hypothetical protein